MTKGFFYSHVGWLFDWEKTSELRYAPELLEDNDISDNALAGVEIKTGGDPTVRHNQIHDGEMHGVMVQTDGRGTLEDNDISGNALAGVAIKTSGDPTLRRNQIRDGKSVGVHVYDDGRGTLEDNDITGNAKTFGNRAATSYGSEVVPVAWPMRRSTDGYHGHSRTTPWA